MTGYELAQFFDESTSWVWSAPHSNIYPQLRKMEEEGLLTSRTEIRGERLERTVYSISDKGITELRGWVSSDPGPVNQRDPLFLRATFFDMVDDDDAEALLEEFIARQSDLVKQWQEHREALVRKDTPLIKERLKRRPRTEHERIAALEGERVPRDDRSSQGSNPLGTTHDRAPARAMTRSAGDAEQREVRIAARAPVAPAWSMLTGTAAVGSTTTRSSCARPSPWR